jgi:serine/threonine protein kinase
MPNWRDEWEEVRELGRGGQGTTVLVRQRTSPTIEGVLKVLNDTQDRQARFRMFEEASTLRLLDGAAGKAPKLLDDWTYAVDDPTDHPFFVMEFIPGQTVENLMKERRSLPVNVAVDLTIDLARAIGACHEKQIVHRDLKPGNLMVRDIDNADVVILDFGLSFNKGEVRAVPTTKPGERIGNGFTNLPERNIQKAQRRFESDLTAVCGHLYYFITGHNPLPFRDENDKAPHRRGDEFSVGAAIGEHPSVSRIETILDRAFEYAISLRFARADELIERLVAIRHLREVESLSDAIESGNKALERSSAYRMAAARERAKTELGRLGESLWNEVRAMGGARPGQFSFNSLASPFTFQFVPRVPHDDSLSGGAKSCRMALGILVSVKDFPEAAAGAEILVASRGCELVVFERKLGSTVAGIGTFPTPAAYAFGVNVFHPDGQWVERHVWNSEVDSREELLRVGKATLSSVITRITEMLDLK